MKRFAKTVLWLLAALVALVVVCLTLLSHATTVYVQHTGTNLEGERPRLPMAGDWWFSQWSVRVRGGRMDVSRFFVAGDKNTGLGQPVPPRIELKRGRSAGSGLPDDGGWFRARTWSMPGSREHPTNYAGFRSLRFPIWLLWPVVLSPFLVKWFLSARRRRPRAAGYCRACGYDLRATPDRCPECGEAAGPINSPSP